VQFDLELARSACLALQRGTQRYAADNAMFAALTSAVLTPVASASELENWCVL
jgi:hypothetical protein